MVDFLQTPNFFQYATGFLALVFSLMVIWNKNPVVSAVSLMGTMFMTAALYFALGSFFMGAVQILVYAGAVAVLFVFIVMLLDVKRSSVEVPGRSAIFGVTALAVGALCAFFVIYVLNTELLSEGAAAEGAVQQTEGLSSDLSAQSIANYFLSKHMVPFQAAGFIILASILGVVFLGRKPAPSKAVEDV